MSGMSMPQKSLAYIVVRNNLVEGSADVKCFLLVGNTWQKGTKSD